MTLTSGEQEGITGFLANYFSDDILRQLVDTVTERRVSAESRDEMIEAIVSHTLSADEFLRRKKVTKDVLFTYLQDLGLKPQPSMDKDTLISMALQQWASDSSGVASGGATGYHPAGQRAQYDDGAAAVQAYTGDGAGSTGVFDPQTVAQEFASVFYGQLQPFALDPHIFFDDCTLQLMNYSTRSVERQIGAHDVLMRFQSLSESDILLYPSHTPRSVLGALNEHGMLAVIVKGTMNSPGTVLGVFMQTFLLCRDPFQGGSWRVKTTELNIRTQQAGIQSSAEDAEEFALAIQDQQQLALPQP